MKPKIQTEEAVKLALQYRNKCMWTVGTTTDGSLSADVTVMATCLYAFLEYRHNDVVCAVSLKKFVEKRSPLSGVWAKLRSLVAGKVNA